MVDLKTHIQIFYAQVFQIMFVSLYITTATGIELANAYSQHIIITSSSRKDVNDK